MGNLVPLAGAQLAKRTDEIKALVAEFEGQERRYNELRRKSLDLMFRIGDALIEMKSSLKHGEWIPWVENNLPWDRKYVSEIMQASRTHDEEARKCRIIRHLTPFQVLQDARPKAHVAQNSGENEWYTPSKFIESARKVMGSIDTDPASCVLANETVRAEVFFTKDDDGLSREWWGNVWMNPPYAQPLIAEFAEAVASKYESGEIEQAIVLVNNATETAWFRRMHGVASAVCWPDGRIRFVDKQGKESGAPLQGQALLYIGESADLREAFIAEFSQYGITR